MIQKKILDILCCPKRNCRGDLLQISEDKLSCVWCKDVYPVHENIPILFPNATQSNELHARHWDLSPYAKGYAKKYNNYIKKQGSPFGQYTHQSELRGIRKLTDGIDLKDAVILDCGCGNGRLLTEYKEARIKIGFDASLNLLVEAKLREPDFWFVCGQAEDMPFKDAIADFSVSIRVFQHLRAQEDAFGEMVRVTKPRGFVALENYNKINLKELYKRLRMSALISKVWPWGLSYDSYTSFRDIKKWSKMNFVKPIRFVGAGWGFYFYFLEWFKFRRFAPQSFQKLVYTVFFSLEKIVQGTFPWTISMEKICFIGSIQPVKKSKRSAYEKVKEKIKFRLNKKIIDKKIKLFENRNYAYVSDDKTHLQKTIHWITEAQDSTADSGVSRGFSLLPGTKSNDAGWQPSYPETTGYIIPTLIQASFFFNDKGLERRAERMANWEIEIAMQEGGIQGGNVSEKAYPAVFDTGQVIRGFTAAFEVTKNKKYLEAAIRAADWIMKRETDKKGLWKNDNARSVSQENTTYNIYAVSPIAQLGQLLSNKEYMALARRTAEYTVSTQDQNGWFKYCDFTDPERPLLHTIGYTIDGLFDIGVILGKSQFINAALHALDGVLGSQEKNGTIPGRLDKNWKGVSDFSCITGIAQISITCVKAYEYTKNMKYLESARLGRDFIKTKQNNYDASLAPIGSLWGSAPISGSYGSYQALNWAAKFFADLLMELSKYEK